MYTEIKEIVNFIAKYLLGRIPRRPVGIFASELGNQLIIRFSESKWDPNNPKTGEAVRVIEIKCNNSTSKVMLAAAKEAGIEIAEILSLFPTNLRIFGNPGNVYYRATESALAVPIWIGSIEADIDYHQLPEWALNGVIKDAERSLSNMGGAGKTVYVGQIKSPVMDNAVNDLVKGWYVPLALENSTDFDSNLHVTSLEYNKRFVFKPHSSQTYTAREFSQTRFGSSKIRPDVDAMINLKHVAVARQLASHESLYDSGSFEMSSLAGESLSANNIYEDAKNDLFRGVQNSISSASSAHNAKLDADEKSRLWTSNWTN